MGSSSFILTVFLFNLLAYASIKLRSKLFHNEVFKPMIWNMKLSVFPIFVIVIGSLLFITFLFIHNYFNIGYFYYLGQIVLWVTLILWLLFLPNSAYLVTELNLTHRSEDVHEVPIWYDILSVLTLSLSGVLNTLFGIVYFQVMYLIYFDPLTISFKNSLFLNLSALIIIILVSIGIYLGREIRFNTWDLLHPIKFIKRLFNHWKKPDEFKNCVLFISFHTIFILLMYISFAPSFT